MIEEQTSPAAPDASPGRYLITGGGGFIGSNVAWRLVREGRSVRILDNFSTGRVENLEGIEKDVELVRGDIRDGDVVSRAMKGVDFVLHLAALSSVPRSLEDPAATTEVNVTGTVVALESARRAGVQCFVHASSSAVYGNTKSRVKSEDLPTAPISPYGVSKLASEFYCRLYDSELGLPTVVIRYFNVFGPRQDPDSPYAAVIPKFIRALRAGTPPVVFGDGEQSRDFTFIDNVVDANLRACIRPEARGHVMNIACGRSITVNRMVHSLRQFIGAEVEPRHEQKRPGDIEHSLADVSRARSLIGFEPRVHFDDGLKKTVDWFVNVP